jgi:hypothetical protein
MSCSVSSRGIQRDHNARSGRQAPLSGWRGAHTVHNSSRPEGRPGDTIADARGLAEGTA